VSIDCQRTTGVSLVADAQIPTTSEQIAKPVMVFFSRYGARARSNAGEARMRAS
jgi:hypothetical protein